MKQKRYFFVSLKSSMLATPSKVFLFVCLFNIIQNQALSYWLQTLTVELLLCDLLFNACLWFLKYIVASLFWFCFSNDQYQEEIQELNEVARHRPRSTLVMGIQQENRQIRELQQENKGKVILYHFQVPTCTTGISDTFTIDLF